MKIEPINKENWICYAVWLCPPALLWCLVHEGAHAIAAIVQGCEVLYFKPYPHRPKGKHWVFGWMKYSYMGDQIPNHAVISLAPYIADAVAITAFLIGAAWTGGLVGVVLLLFCILPLCNTGTAIAGRINRTRETDLIRPWSIEYVPYVCMGYGAAAALFLVVLFLLLL